MKKLKRLSLQSISKAEMEKQKQNELRGGQCYWNDVHEGGCHCGCLYAGPQEGPDDSYYGGAYTVDNYEANGA